MKNKIAISVVFLTLGLAQCRQAESFQVSNDFDEGKALVEHQNRKIKEVSGLAASFVNPGLMWAQNDSGNDPEVYLINDNLEIVYTVKLANVGNRDWEDIALGPGPEAGKTYLYVADIGDNRAVYPEKMIYRFAEPRMNTSRKDTTISSFDTIVFRLEDGAKDTESLLIDHKTRNLYVISKRESPVHVYELKYPYKAGEMLTASKEISLPFSYAVGADYRASNGDVVVKNYDHIFYWKNSGQKDLMTLLSSRPVSIPYIKEPQGEAIAWTIDGSGFYTLSEREKKEKTFLYFYKKR